MKKLIILSAVFCSFNQVNTMSLTIQPVSENVQKKIDAIYESHELKVEANKFKFRISYDKKMLSEKDVQNGIIEGKNDEMLIASAFSTNGQPIIIISPALNKWIELGTSCDHGEAIHSFAIYQLLSILKKHHYHTLPNVILDEKSIAEYANKFAVQHMSLQCLGILKRVIENSVMEDSNYAGGLPELIGKEIQKRKK